MENTSTLSLLVRPTARADPGSPLVALGLLLALAAVLLLLLQSLVVLAAGDITAGMRYGLIGGAAGFAATALGALPALFLRAVPQRGGRRHAGFAAGMMLAASAFSPVAAGPRGRGGITGDGFLAAAVVVTGMALGVLLMLGLDQFTPMSTTRRGLRSPATRAAPGSGCSCSPSPCTTCRRAWPSGPASPQGDMAVGLPLTTAIALQDIPEGWRWRSPCAPPVFVPAGRAGGHRQRSAGTARGPARVGLASGMAIAYPIGLGLAAGAMLFVVSHEVIPETHRNGHQTHATLGLMVGFALMMTLDTALG